MTSPWSPTTEKLASPGAFRMALALAVFLHHSTGFNIGMSAVLIFFVLSGYWVATMWTHTYAHTRAPYLTYLVSRVWRITPVFALCSLISWILLLVRQGRPESVGNLAHQIFSNILILGYNSLPFQANVPGWSLDMEIQFYLVAPLIIFLISRSAYAVFVCLLISVCSRWLGGGVTVAPFMYFFGVGVAAAILDLKSAPTLARASLYATLAIIAFCLLLLVKNMLFREIDGPPLLAFSSRSNTLIAVTMIPWALYTVRQETSPQDRMLGDLSYIFYLLHWSVLGALHAGEGSYLHRFFVCAFALALIMAASRFIWVFYDRPINRLRAQWVARRGIVPESSPAPF
jgi:peptidoglycan/LPS O-acetylase OafA/YrhL